MKLVTDNSPKSIKEQFWIQQEDEIIDVDFDLRVVEEFPKSWIDNAKDVDIWSLAISDDTPKRVMLMAFPIEGGHTRSEVKQVRVIRHEEFGGILQILIMDKHRYIWKCRPRLVASTVQFSLNMMYYDFPRSLLDIKVLQEESSQIETPEPLPVHECSDDCGECIYDLEAYGLDLKPGESKHLRCYKTDEENRVKITRTK